MQHDATAAATTKVRQMVSHATQTDHSEEVQNEFKNNQKKKTKTTQKRNWKTMKPTKTKKKEVEIFSAPNNFC